MQWTETNRSRSTWLQSGESTARPASECQLRELTTQREDNTRGLRRHS